MDFFDEPIDFRSYAMSLGPAHIDSYTNDVYYIPVKHIPQLEVK